MTIEMENLFFVNYGDRIQIDDDILIVAAWNKYIEYGEGGKKIHLNGKEFFENSFTNKCDAVWAVSLSEAWRWIDSFVYFDSDGHLVSLNHWDYDKSPIDIDKIDINRLINNLKK